MKMLQARIKVRDILIGIIGTGKVWYQTPDQSKLTYPCIRYDYAGPRNTYADNGKYIVRHAFTVTLMTDNPLDELVDELMELKNSEYDRPYKSEGIYHHVYTITI